MTADHYAEMLRGAGADSHYHLLKAESALRRGMYLPALDHLVHVKEDGGLEFEAAVVGAQCYIALRRPHDADVALRYVLDQKPDHVDALRWLAAVYYDQGDLIRAVILLEKVRDLDPSDGRSVWLLGTSQRDLERLDDAIAAYEEALRRKPDMPDVAELRVELAECYLKQQRHAEVIRTLEPIDVPAAIALRSEALIGLGQEAEAIALMDAGLARHPDYMGLLRLRGERYQVHGDAEEAVRMLERVVAALPADFRSRTNLAYAYEALGRSAEAEREHQRVKDTIALIQKVHDKNQEAMRNPWEARVRRELAELCEKIDRPELARMWRRAADSCPPNR